MDCVFCNIVNNKVPSTKEFEDDDIIVIADILPKAPVHMLVISKKHINALSEVATEDTALMGKMLIAAADVAKRKQIATSGFRVVINSGKDSGQIVQHLHFHVLGGKKFSE